MSAEADNPKEAKEFTDKLRELGFIQSQDVKDMVKDATEAAYQNGIKTSLIHKTCDEPTCKICELRHGIEGAAFQNGVEKGLKLGEAKIG